MKQTRTIFSELLIIIYNVAWIGYDAETNDEQNILDAPLRYIVMEYAGCFLSVCTQIVCGMLVLTGTR